MENISSKALAKDRSGYTAARSIQSSCCLARGQPWAGRSAGRSMSQHELSTSLGEHARSELCLGVSQDHTCISWSLGSMSEMIDQDDWTRRPSPSHETTWKRQKGSECGLIQGAWEYCVNISQRGDQDSDKVNQSPCVAMRFTSVALT